MADKMRKLEAECEELKKRLAKQSEVKEEIEALKEELEKSLETHAKLQEVALAFEEENRSLHEKYNIQLKERSVLDARLLDLEHEIESRKQSYENLEKRYKRTQEKVDKFEDMEELVCALERDKKKLSERIPELEDELSAYKSGHVNLKKELDECKSKLAKENADLNEKLETYIEEMEELDSKVENLEIENERLKKEIERYHAVETFGNGVAEIDELEAEKDQLLSKLHKEVEKRENVENELFKLEEEMETCKIQHENENAILTDRIRLLENELGDLQVVLNSKENSVSKMEGDLRHVERGTSLHIEELETDKADLQSKLRVLEQEREILLEENSGLASEHMDLRERYQSMKDSYDKRVAQLESRMTELIEHKNSVEKENLDNLLKTADKEYELNNQKYSISKDMTITKEQLKSAQDQLLIASEKNVQLQAELDDLVRQRIASAERHQHLLEERQMLNSDFAKEKADLMRKFEEEKNEAIKRLTAELYTLRSEAVVKAESVNKSYLENSVEVGSDISVTPNQLDLYNITLKYEQDKEDLQSKIIDQNITIQNLEDRIAALIAYDKVASSTSRSISPETTPPVPMRNGGLVGSRDKLNDLSRNGESPRPRFRDADDPDEFDTTGALGDREIRRVAYRIADGDWVRMATEIEVSHNKALQIVNSTLNDNEKVYQLLATWVHEKGLSRALALKTLLEIFESTKRKDVTKILKEMLGEAGNAHSSKKKKFLSFRKSKKI